MAPIFDTSRAEKDCLTETDMLLYYAQRAQEYERIYHKAERQHDLSRLHQVLPSLLAGADVLEIACGTGYWTQIIAPVARSVTAIDANEEVLAIARSKTYPPGRVEFQRADAYDLSAVSGTFTAGFAAFWWSHVPKEDLQRFLNGLHARLVPGGRAVILDNRYIEGSSTPISHTDDRGNTYQERHLDDGSVYEVLKNFPTATELHSAMAGIARDVFVEELPYYWCMSYSIDAPA